MRTHLLPSQDKRTIQFVDWCPTGFKCGINYQPPAVVASPFLYCPPSVPLPLPRPSGPPGPLGPHNRPSDQPNDRPSDRPTERLTEVTTARRGSGAPTTDRATDRTIYRASGRPSKRPSDQPIDRPSDRPGDRSNIDRMTDLAIDRRIDPSTLGPPGPLNPGTPTPLDEAKAHDKCIFPEAPPSALRRRGG